MTQALDPPGYNTRAVEAWIAANVPQLQAPLTWKQLEGGHSNLTYMLTDAQGHLAVIRRPPLGELLPRAHDMAREWKLISALGPTNVPVPAALGFCEDTSVTGSLFYIMGHIDGHPLYNAEDTQRWLPPGLRQDFAHSYIDVLADLHALDPDELGLGDLSKRDSYVGRQVKSWYRSWTASAGPADYDDPRAHEIEHYLTAHLPDQGLIRVVHGDYGLHNVLVGADGKVAAVVDWEIASLGDPLADLAYALNAWTDPDDAPSPRGESATRLPGFPLRATLAVRYAERTGRDLSHLDYYTAFNRWKSAAIIHGVYARYVEGKKSSEGINLEDMRASISGLLSMAIEALDRVRV